MKYHDDIVWLFEEINSPKFAEFSEEFCQKVDNVKKSFFFFDRDSLNLLTLNNSMNEEEFQKMEIIIDENLKEGKLLITIAGTSSDEGLGEIAGIPLSFENMLSILKLEWIEPFSKIIHNFARWLLYEQGFKLYISSDCFKKFRTSGQYSERFIKDTLPSFNSKKLRPEIVQMIIDKLDAKRYLEVGVHSFETFNKIVCDEKVAVDPLPRYDNYKNRDNESVVEKTSDLFFNDEDIEKFDVIFLDGFHEANQLKRDIDSSLKNLSDEGIIVCHDCNPSGYLQQAFPPKTNGDCWRAFTAIVEKRKDLEAFVVNCDHGIGIIRRKKNSHKEIQYSISDISFIEFETNKREILKLCKYSEFNDWIDKL